MKLYFLSILSSFFIVFESYAVTCVSGCQQRIDNNITQTITSNNNNVGKIITGPLINTGSLKVRVKPGTMSDWAVYKDDPIPAPGYKSQSWKYINLDEYISMALAISGPCGTFYFPYNMQSTAQECKPAVFETTKDINVTPRSFQSSIKINKKIVSGTYIKNIFLAQEGRCQPYGCKTKDVIYYNVYLNINLKVPQTCEINSGQIINIDFGNISVGSFKNSGAIAEGVNPIVRNVAVKCDNIEYNSELTMRVQANKVAGNAIVSSNSDIGFVVADHNTGKEITPNNLSSLIPFLLDGNARAIIPIRVYPISITGNRPTEGPVTSEGFLRVDFP